MTFPYRRKVVPNGISFYCTGYLDSTVRGDENVFNTLDKAKQFAEDGFKLQGTLRWGIAFIEELHKDESLKIEGKETPVGIAHRYAKKINKDWVELPQGKLVNLDDL